MADAQESHDSESYTQASLWVAWAQGYPSHRDKSGQRQQGLELDLTHRRHQAGSVAAAAGGWCRGWDGPEQPAPSCPSIPAPGTPKAPLLGAAWHSPVRDTLGPFSLWARLGEVSSRKGQCRLRRKGPRLAAPTHALLDSPDSVPTPTAQKAEGVGTEPGSQESPGVRGLCWLDVDRIWGGPIGPVS